MNVLKNQLKTGKFEKPTIFSVVKDSGAIDVAFEESKQHDDYKIKAEAESCHGTKHGDTRCHQGKQTDLFSHSIADTVYINQKRRY